MTRPLPQPAPAVKAALRLLPHEPGVYMFRNMGGRVMYVGRSRDLATRVRSYWNDLRDRPHLRRMVEQVQWVEPVLCKSEHEAAFLESDLLERHPTHYNRTLGMESCVWIRLDADPRTPSLQVMHDLAADDGARWFGPYLGWEPARLAAAGLQRIFPLRYSGIELSTFDREMARSLGVTVHDSSRLVAGIERVLRREPAAVRAAIRGLERVRDRASAQLMFEHAAVVQEQIRGIRWICEPQKLAGLDAMDADYGATARVGAVAIAVVLMLRGGRLAQRHLRRLISLEAGAMQPAGAGPYHREWMEQARRNAELMAGLASAGAVGPLGWRIQEVRPG